MEFDLNSCRICLTQESTFSELFSFYDNQSIADKFSFISGIEIDSNDELPQRICDTCLIKVLSACDIKEKCVETDRILRQKLKIETFFDGENIKDEKDILNVETNNELEMKNQQKTKKNRKSTQVDRKSISKSDEFLCFFCEKRFDKISLKNQHVKQDHALELVCKICDLRRPSSTSTEKCLRDHKLGFNFLCQICAKTFRHRYYLIKHQATFHAESGTIDLFSCDTCGLKTKYKMNLYRHVKSVHLNSHKFPCPHKEACPNVNYTTSSGLSIHLYRVHGLQAPVTCSLCNLGFSFVSELKIHRKICGGSSKNSGVGTKNRNFKQFCELTDAGFKCKVCQKVFVEKQNWSYHYSSTHRDNRTCEICNKEFTNYTNFYRHVNVQHKKIKKFHCDYPNCEKSFGQKGSLINHINTHTGEKPFSCTLCSFRSGDKSSVIKHKKKIHSQEKLTLFL